MRRGLRFRQDRTPVHNTGMSRDLDWVVDQWRASSPEMKLQLVLTKIRHEEKLPQETGKRAI